VCLGSTPSFDYRVNITLTHFVQEEKEYNDRTRSRIADAPKIGSACAGAKTKNGKEFFAGPYPPCNQVHRTALYSLVISIIGLIQHVAIYDRCVPEGRVTSHYFAGNNVIPLPHGLLSCF
jgi:hypothetical protein